MKSVLRLILAVGLMGATSRRAYSTEHSLLDSFLGISPEERAAKNLEKTNKARLNAATVQLAQRIATLSLCTSTHAHRGRELGTLNWYTSTALSKWNDEILSQFPPSAELDLDRNLFEKAFQDEIKKRLNIKKLPRALKRHSEDFSKASEVLTQNALARNRRLGTSTQSFNLLGSELKQKVLNDLLEIHDVSQGLQQAGFKLDCSIAKRGSVYWARYSFFGAAPHADKRPASVSSSKPPKVKEIPKVEEEQKEDREETARPSRSTSHIAKEVAEVLVGKMKSNPLRSPPGYCAARIRAAFQETGVFKRHPGWGSAYMYAKNLEAQNKTHNILSSKYNMTKLNIYSPTAAPDYSIIVYGGAGNGHIEQKIPVRDLLAQGITEVMVFNSEKGYGSKPIDIRNLTHVYVSDYIDAYPRNHPKSRLSAGKYTKQDNGRPVRAIYTIEGNT